jgi:hypothetical protein
MWYAGVSLLALSMLSSTAASDAVDASTYASQNRKHTRDGLFRFRSDMPRTIRSDHPAIVPVAAAIRAVTPNPLEQIVMVNDVTHLLVDYDHDERVYGRTEYQATLDEMIARRRQAGWVNLRDDCDGRAVFAAHLLASLGIPWRLQASYWQRHAWVTASVNGVDYDLLRLSNHQSDQSNFSYRMIGRHFVRAEKRPPLFRWRQAWCDRTHSDLRTGQLLGLLDPDATSGEMRLRSAVDWTKVHPEGLLSPFDPRMLKMAFSAFPLGENLRHDTLASAQLQPEARRRTRP